MHKYYARPTTLDGIRFASQAEATRYAELVLLQRAGLIRDLKLQPRYPLDAYSTLDGRHLIGEYVGDFEYVDVPTRALITEDVKGMLTALYRWKKKHFQAQYGRVIFEVRA